MKLIYKATKELVKIGDQVVTEKGHALTVTYFRQPSSPSSEGKVSVRLTAAAYDTEYYVSVIGAEWIEREDRGEGPSSSSAKLTPAQELVYYATVGLVTLANDKILDSIQVPSPLRCKEIVYLINEGNHTLDYTLIGGRIIPILGAIK